MAIKIYFDNDLIPDNGIMALSQSGELFDSTFKLGATLCREVKLQVSIRYLTNEAPKVVKIYDDEGIKFTLYVDNKEKVDDMSYSYTLVDSMVKLNIPLSNIFNWDTSQAYTVQFIVDKICDYIGSKHIVVDYIGSLSMNWGWDTQARDFLSYAAEINASFVRISPMGDIEFIEHKNATTRHLDVATCEDIAVGEYHKINRVGYEQGTASIYYPSDQVEFNTVYINQDNVLITDSGGFTRENIIKHIYDKINGFEFYSIKINRCQVEQSAMSGDNLIIKAIKNCKLTTPDGKYITDELGRKILVALEEGLPTIVQINWNYNAHWNGGYELEIDSLQQEETQIVDTATKKVRKLEITVDRELGKITQKVTEVDTKIDATNKDLTDYKQTVSETYSTIEQTSTSISESVEAMKTTIEGDVEQKYATKASLELYVTEDEAQTNVVSWINASADNIILNTKKLIFGEYPNGQFITVENKETTSGEKVGVLFDGSGEIYLQPKGYFIIKNGKDNYVNSLSLSESSDGSTLNLHNQAKPGMKWGYNDIYMIYGGSGTYQYIALNNIEDNNTRNDVELQIQNGANEGSIWLSNKYQGNENSIKLSSKYGVEIRNAVNCELVMDMNRNGKLQIANSLELISTNYKVYIKATDFTNGEVHINTNRVYFNNQLMWSS